MQITREEYRKMVEYTMKIIKKRFNNLSTDEVQKLAFDIVDEIIKVVDIQQ